MSITNKISGTKKVEFSREKKEIIQILKMFEIFLNIFKTIFFFYEIVFKNVQGFSYFQHMKNIS